MSRDPLTRPEVARVEEELRALRPRDPDPALRERVMAAARQAAAGRERRQLGGWGVELALAAGILLATVLTGLVGPRPSGPPAGAEVSAATREACRALDRLPEDWLCRRLAMAERAPSPGAGWPLGGRIDGAVFEGAKP